MATTPLPELTAEPFRLMIDGDWAAAAAEWERRGATYLRAEALAAGDEAAAGEALRILDGLGATRAAEFHRAEMRKRGISRVPRGPRRTTVANSAGLTPRQVDVLALLVEGLSNAEIATRLTLSAKTVDHHVQAVLRKLGVASRGQAAATGHPAPSRPGTSRTAADPPPTIRLMELWERGRRSTFSTISCVPARGGGRVALVAGEAGHRQVDRW